MITAMTGMAEFGALIRRARENVGLTGVELAQRVGRPHSFVARIEGGKYSNPPDPHDFDALARELRITKEEMLRSIGYLDPPRHDEEEAARLGVDSGEDVAFVHALMAYLPALGPPQRAHLIETARYMADAAITRASSPAASDSPADEPTPHPPGHQEEA